jgi:subtilase family serine protease
MTTDMQRRLTSKGLVSGVAACSAAVALIMVAAANPVVRAQSPSRRAPQNAHVPRVVSSQQATLVNSVPLEQRLHASIQLPLRDEVALDALLQRIYDPQSPDYRHFLSVAEFTSRFGPTAPDYQKLLDFVRSHGLTVTDTPANRMLVGFEGSAADVQKAFHVTLNRYQHPTESRIFFAPDTEPSIDLDLAVLHISGLDDYATRVSMIHRSNAVIANITGSGPGGYFTGKDLRAAYGGGTSLTGAGQTVGLLEFGPYNIADVNSYFSSLGQPLNVPIRNVVLDGMGPCNGCDDGEETLDIEYAISIAPGLSQLIVYEGTSDVDILNRMASDNIAKQLSCSFGWLPGDPGNDDPIFKEFAAQGQNFFTASGDSGAYSSSNSSWFPMDDPFVTAVGGTSLTTNGAGGSWASETAWKGSGGGVSTSGYAIPSYQSGVANSSNQGSTTLRNIPDVAANADTNMYWCANGGCFNGIGGTSAAAPQWAGFMALVNQQRVANGQPTLGFLNPTLYSIGKGSTYTSNLHDTKTGNNFNSSSPSKYSAATGFDLVTGWGSPNGPSLINTLAGGTPAPTATPGATPTGTPSGTKRYRVVNANSGKCVDASASGTANGTVVQQYTCNSTNAQAWDFTPTTGGYYRVATSNASGQVWDVTGASTSDGAKVVLWSNNGGTNQQWLMQPIGSYYRFVARHSGKCLDVPGSSTANVQLQQYTCNSTNAQSFSLVAP